VAVYTVRSDYRFNPSL